MAGKGKSGGNKNGHSLPAYQRIQKVIRERIAAGDLTTGDVVQSERELVRIHGVSLMTARHALSSLEQEGIVERRRGNVHRSAENSFQQINQLHRADASRGLATSEPAGENSAVATRSG